MARILLVEDDEVLMEDLRHMLRGWGHVTDLARDLKPAYKAIRRYTPDLIISDINLPSGLGFELLNYIGNQQFGVAGTPVILMSSLSDQASILYGEMCGAVHYLIKPVDHGELKELIDRRLRGRKSWFTRALLGEPTSSCADGRDGRRQSNQRPGFGIRR